MVDILYCGYIIEEQGYFSYLYGITGGGVM